MEDHDGPPQIYRATFERSTSFERAASLAEDQASMTIEFLRARLLSERSVSKAARQRAQQLTKKVAELEQSMKVEMKLRKKLEEARWDVLSRHKAELGEEFGHLSISVLDRPGTEGQDVNLSSEEGSQLQYEHEKSYGDEGLNTSEGTKAGQEDRDGDGDGDGDYNIEDMDRFAREKGSLAWASRRGHKRLQDKEWARSFRQSSRSFSPMSFGAPTSDCESPRRRWVGKSVRQVRTRTASMDMEGKAEVKQEQAKDIPQSDEEKDVEVEKAIEQQTELIEKFEAEENAQRAWEEKYRERYPSNEHNADQDDSLSRRDKEVLFKSAEDELEERLESTMVKGVSAGPSQEHGSPERELLEGFSGGQGDQTTMVVKVMGEEDNDSAQALMLHGRGTYEDGAVELPKLKVSMEGIAIEVPCNGKPENAAYDCDATALGHNQEAKSSLSHAMKQAVDMSAKVLDNQIEHLHLTSVRAHDGSRDVLLSSKFDASSIASSQGSNSGALDSATLRRQDLYSTHANSQEQFGRMCGESSERRSMNCNYNQESFGQSLSMTSDNDKARKVPTDKEMASTSSFSSPAKSYGSCKSLMNSSWDDIFKRKIKAQDPGQIEHARDPNSDSSQTHSKQPFSHKFDRPVMHTPYTDHSTRGSHIAHEERRPNQRMYRKSVDVGLDRVMEVLRALEIAKHQVEGSNEHVMEPYGYPPLHYVPHGMYYPSLPARGMDSYFYDMENMRARMAVGYVPSPSRQSINMQHALMRGDPMVEQSVSSLDRSYVHPTYASRRG